MPFDFSGYESTKNNSPKQQYKEDGGKSSKGVTGNAPYDPLVGDMGDTAYHPILGKLPSPPRRHSEVELPSKYFVKENVKEGMTKEVEPTKPSFDFGGYERTQKKSSPITPEKKEGIPKGYIGDSSEISKLHKEAQDIYKKLSEFFTRTEGHDLSLSQMGKEALGGGTAGAVTGLAGPKIAELAGKFIPGVPGKALQALGTAWGAMGPAARTTLGAIGGASSGAVTEVAASQGLSPAEQMAVGLISSGSFEGAAKYLTPKGSILIGKLFGSMAVGSPSGISGAALGLLGENKIIFKRAAEKEMEAQFGKKIPGYTEGLEGISNRADLRNTLLNSNTEIPKDFQGSVSKFYREKLFGVEGPDKVFRGSEVSKRILLGNKFSESSPYYNLQSKLEDAVKGNFITKKQKDDILSDLSTDKARNLNVINKYPQKVDELIREWGAPSEGGIKEGYKAVNQKLAETIRGDIRDSYNTWLQSQGLGRLEQKYRDVYKLEKIAEAKDKIPHLLQYGTADSIEKTGRAIAQDPDTKNILLKEVGTYLREVPANKLVPVYNRLDKLLVGNGLLETNDILPIRNAAKEVSRVATEGEKIKKLDRFRRILLRSLPYQTGAMSQRQQEDNRPLDTGE